MDDVQSGLRTAISSLAGHSNPNARRVEEWEGMYKRAIVQEGRSMPGFKNPYRLYTYMYTYMHDEKSNVGRILLDLAPVPPRIHVVTHAQGVTTPVSAWFALHSPCSIAPSAGALIG
jgi:hypothetical protein